MVVAENRAGNLARKPRNLARKTGNLARKIGNLEPAKPETSAYNPYDINCSSLFTEIVFSLHLPILAGTTRVILPPRIFLSCIAALARSHALYGQRSGNLNRSRISKISSEQFSRIHILIQSPVTGLLRRFGN